MNKEKISEAISDCIVRSLTRDELEKMVRDTIFLELLDKSWGDIKSVAEEVAPFLLNEFPPP